MYLTRRYHESKLLLYTSISPHNDSARSSEAGGGGGWGARAPPPPIISMCIRQSKSKTLRLEKCEPNKFRFIREMKEPSLALNSLLVHMLQTICRLSTRSQTSICYASFAH